MITADHGNAEQMFSPSGGPHTAHTTNRGIMFVCLFVCLLVMYTEPFTVDS